MSRSTRLPLNKGCKIRLDNKDLRSLRQGGSNEDSFFSIDALADLTYEGYTQDENWNGWDCPYFAFHVAEQLVVAWKDRGWAAHYDQHADAFVFSVGHDLETGNPAGEEAFAAVEVEGRKLYGIGAFDWTWEEALEESATQR